MRSDSADWEIEILLARVLELPVGKQLRVYGVLEEMLGEERLGIETERSKQVRARLDAVRAMREAAAHLGLPHGEAPSVAEFKTAAKERKLCKGFNSVYAAFDRRWELATRFYEGLPIPLTVAQRRIQRTSRTQRQDPVSALRLWWAETSPRRDAPAEDYRDWAVERNELRQPGQKRVGEHPDHLCKRLAVSWAEAVALASGEKTLHEAQRDTKEAHLRVAGPLVVRTMVKEILGVPRQQKSLRLPNFPNPVARFGEQSLWRVDDVRAYAAGKRDFVHAPHIEQHLYLDEESVAAVLRIDVPLLRTRFKGRSTRGNTQVPQPVGRFRAAGAPRTSYYWLRSDVEAEVERMHRRRAITDVRMRRESTRKRQLPRR